MLWTESHSQHAADDTNPQYPPPAEASLCLSGQVERCKSGAMGTGRGHMDQVKVEERR